MDARSDPPYAGTFFICWGDETLNMIVRVAAFFVLGYPSETMQDLLMTEKFIADNEFDEIYLHIFQPLPGTPIFDRLVSPKSYI